MYFAIYFKELESIFCKRVKQIAQGSDLLRASFQFDYSSINYLMRRMLFYLLLWRLQYH